MDDEIYKCKECGSIKLIVKKRDSCSDCKHNGISIEGEYVYLEELPANAIRSQVEYDSSCQVCDGCTGDGCWMLICSECNELVDIVTCLLG